jgi:hypothetical protein
MSCFRGVNRRGTFLEGSRTSPFAMRIDSIRCVTMWGQSSCPTDEDAVT